MCNIFSSAATIMWFVNQAASDVRNCDTQKTLIYILIFIYYINTSEIPSELLYENFISSQVKITLSSHVKRSPWLWLHNNLHLFHSGVYIINRMLHARSWIWILSSCVQLDISLFFAEHSALSYLLSLIFSSNHSRESTFSHVGKAVSSNQKSAVRVNQSVCKLVHVVFGAS